MSVRCSAGLPAVFVIAWAVMTERELPDNCWTGYARLPSVWLLISPMITALGVSTTCMGAAFRWNIVRASYGVATC